MTDKEWGAQNIFDVFGDPLSRQMLILASQKPLSANDFVEYLNASDATVYRRLDTLKSYDLIEENVEYQDNGNHYKAYETTFKQITFEIESGGYNVDISLRQSLLDQFEAFWDDLDQSSPRVELDIETDTDYDAETE